MFSCDNKKSQKPNLNPFSFRANQSNIETSIVNDNRNLFDITIKPKKTYYDKKHYEYSIYFIIKNKCEKNLNLNDFKIKIIENDEFKRIGGVRYSRDLTWFLDKFKNIDYRKTIKYGTYFSYEGGNLSNLVKNLWFA